MTRIGLTLDEHFDLRVKPRSGADRAFPLPQQGHDLTHRLRNGSAEPVYRRFRDHGRLAPDGLSYVASWDDHDITTCYQVMECDNLSTLNARISRWSDLVDFEVVPVMSSADAARAMGPRL